MGTKLIFYLKNKFVILLLDIFRMHYVTLIKKRRNDLENHEQIQDFNK